MSILYKLHLYLYVYLFFMYNEVNTDNVNRLTISLVEIR